MDHHGPTSWLLKIPGLPHDHDFIHVNGAIVVMLFLTVVSILAYFRIKNQIEKHIVPSPGFSFVGIVDLVVEALYGMVCNTLGKGGKSYFPFIASIFVFVFFCNILGLIPLGAAPTANTSTTLALGLASFVYYNIMGIKAQGLKGYLKHFLMGLGPLGVLVAVLEMVSQAVRPISLGVRLFANMHVDHAVVMEFMNMCAWLVPVPLLLFGIVISTIQAFVFAILTAVYTQMAIEH